MVLVGAQRGNISSVGHVGLDREFQRENHKLEIESKQVNWMKITELGGEGLPRSRL